MLNGYIRYCSHIRVFNPVIALSGNGFAEALSDFGSSRNYSKDRGGCCKEIVQSRGKKVEPWPKSDPPPPAWRPECPQEPQLPNYDPYRIKVPDIVVPPLLPSNAKRTSLLWTTPPQSGDQNQQQGQNPYGHQNSYGQQNPYGQEEQTEEETPRTGFFGFLKGLFKGRGKPKGEGEYQFRPETQSGDPKDMLKSTSMNFGDALNPILDLFNKSPVTHPDYWKETTKLPSKADEVQEPLPRLGYHGKNKYKYAFHEPWKPLDRLTLLSQAEKEELEGRGEELSHADVFVTEKC